MQITVSAMDDAALAEALKGLGLSMKLGEARRVAELLERDPTETELTLFDTMWSEHCSYKSSRPLLKEHLPTDGSNVILGPSEDAGIVRLGEYDGHVYGLAIGHESHNHPSQVMPIEGAATGIGGVVRDVYCMGADVIATLDPLRFGDPDGPNGERSREIAREVVEGIALYGNALGVPNLGGDVVFDSGYDDNCLVNVVAIGLVREDHIVRSRVPQDARDEPYDFILVGKPTDWSGMGGAAFASADLDAEAVRENQGSVQVPDPFLKRMLVIANEAMLQLARDENAPIGFKDLGAGGIACVTSELADAAGFGIEVDLSNASLAADDLPNPVAACSETQERFGIACPSRISDKILQLYNETYDLPSMYQGAGARKIGKILIPDGNSPARYRLRRDQEMLVDAPISIITEGIRYDRESAPGPKPSEREFRPGTRDLSADLRDLFGSVHLCSRRPLFQHYDSEVKANTVLRPGEADAGVVAPIPGSSLGMAASVDGNPRFTRVDPYLGASYAVVEAVRNVACVGAIPAAVTDCLNYGSPENPAVMHAFVEGVRGVGDACRGLGRLENPDEPLPVISGNVSFYNQNARGDAVPPSPIICCVGVLDDVSVARSTSLKASGNLLLRVGRFAGQMGGSLYANWVEPGWVGSLPPLDYPTLRAEIGAIVACVREGLVSTVHDVSEGGTLVALGEMALGSESKGRLGVELHLEPFANEFGNNAVLFGEAGAFLVEVEPQNVEAVESAVADRGGWCARLGEVRDQPAISIYGLDSGDQNIQLASLAEAREQTMFRLLSREES